jgi:hypothetical protein
VHRAFHGAQDQWPRVLCRCRRRGPADRSALQRWLFLDNPTTHLPKCRCLGNSDLHLRFTDVDVFPIICADLLQPRTVGREVAQSKLETFLRREPDHRPILITGSLLQNAYNFNWEVAIDSIVNSVAPHRKTVLALANQATSIASADENVDRWRSMSGVFTRSSELRKQSSLPAGRSLRTASIVGMVVRDSGPCVVAGPIAWPPYGPTSDKFVWHPEVLVPLEPTGIVSPIRLPGEIEATEICRFAKRYPSQPMWSPKVVTGLQAIQDHLANTNPPRARTILNSALSGVAAQCDSEYAPCDPDDLGEPLANDAFQIALHALALLLTFDDLSWQRDENCGGQLRRAADDTNILIWRDPVRHSRQMKRLLGLWMQMPGEHARLLIIGEGFRSQLDDGLLSRDRRDDVAEAPGSDQELGAIGGLAAAHEDVTVSRGSRVVACIGVHTFTSHFRLLHALFDR